MKPLEYGKMLKEIFEERLNSLAVAIGYYSELKDSATTERDKAKYDILNMETEVTLEFIKDRLDTLNKVIELNEKIENGDLSFAKKLECMVEIVELMSNLK